MLHRKMLRKLFQVTLPFDNQYEQATVSVRTLRHCVATLSDEPVMLLN